MNKSIHSLACFAAALAISTVAHATAFTYVIASPAGAPQFDATLTFTGTLISPGTYDITNVSGDIASADVTATDFSVPTFPCSATGPSDFCTIPNPAINGATIGYDNLLYPATSPILDNAGLAFGVDGVDFNLFYIGGGFGYQWLDSANFPNSTNVGQPIDVSAVPEPPSLAYLVEAIAAIAAAIAVRRFMAGSQSRA
ncbi:MAG: hypothetical protein WBP85_04555 [Terracidiphilus sp.]